MRSLGNSPAPLRYTSTLRDGAPDPVILACFVPILISLLPSTPYQSKAAVVDSIMDGVAEDHQFCVGLLQ
jgi:hypothetical protein